MSKWKSALETAWGSLSIILFVMMLFMLAFWGEGLDGGGGKLGLWLATHPRYVIGEVVATFVTFVGHTIYYNY